jgi:hypothetical protein
VEIYKKDVDVVFRECRVIVVPMSKTMSKWSLY